jgi:hypothetical protein
MDAAGTPEGPLGDAARHLPRERLERELAALAPPAERGSLELIVSRRADGGRDAPARARLTPDGGVPGDAWARKTPEKLEAQISVMRADVARLLANGQELTLFGDNLLVSLDLSGENLPPGSRLRVGAALLEVTPEPHDGCRKFRQRFGDAALRLTAEHRPERLRGIYARVLEPGEAAVGDPVEVLSRGAA